MEKSISNIANLAPPTSLVLQLGSLALTIAAKSVPLPWELLALFAKNMLDATRRGYTAGYSVVLLPPGVTSINSPSAVQINFSAGLSIQVLKLLAGSEWREPEPVNDGDSTFESSDFGSSSFRTSDADEQPCKRQCPSPPDGN